MKFGGGIERGGCSHGGLINGFLFLLFVYVYVLYIHTYIHAYKGMSGYIQVPMYVSVTCTVQYSTQVCTYIHIHTVRREEEKKRKEKKRKEKKRKKRRQKYQSIQRPLHSCM